MKLAPIALTAAAAILGLSVVSLWHPAVALAQPPAPAAAPAPQAPAAPSAAAEEDNLHHTLDMFRSDLNASKVRTLNQVMKMTAPEAAKFWPIYQKYEAELAKVDDRRIALIKQFVTLSAAGKLTDQAADDIAGKWLAVVQDRLDLWKKYHKEIGAGVSPMRAAQFLQVEHQISLLVDINIASEMPMVGQPK